MEETAPKQAAEPTRRLLIVEDEILIRMMIGEAAREAGYIVVEAGDADTALEYLASGSPVDLVFTDIKLPGPIDGMELARRIASAHPGLPILVTSGHVNEWTVRPLAPFIAKPYRLDEVIERITALLSQQKE